MKLHLDKDAFGVLLEDIHSRTGYRAGEGLLCRSDFE